MKRVPNDPVPAAASTKPKPVKHHHHHTHHHHHGHHHHHMGAEPAPVVPGAGMGDISGQGVPSPVGSPAVQEARPAP